MTKKHFIATAKYVADMQKRTDARIVARAFAAIAERFSERFDRARFMRACELED